MMKDKKFTLDGKSILITGGTGSFGKCIVKELLQEHQIKRLIVFSRDELKQYEMAQDPLIHDATAMRFFIGDVRDQERLIMAMRDVDFVIHAAALKQVPTAEYNPFECIHTNVLGAENVVRAALHTGVKRVIALSTDKAASPINLYGASKLASDKIFVAANNLSGSDGTRFSVVRYGNVLGSRGSVIPHFRKLVAEGAKSIPITDKHMTRFWITMNHGIKFVLSSLEMMRGGEIFIPKIPSMKITDLARVIAPGIEQEVVGVRPGEKLHEVMITLDDNRNTIELDDRYVIEPAFAYWGRNSYINDGGREVERDFIYSSDSNTEWLDDKSLLTLLDDLGI